ncbi:MAG: alpha/beta hydrolase fold domain-containing protein [Pseudomonadota bacterium]
MWDAHKSDPWARLYFAPDPPGAVSRETLERLRRMVDQLDAPVAMRVHDHAGQLRTFEAEHAQRPLPWLASLGFHAFVLAHRFPCASFGSQAPVDDAIEAMRQIRARAAEFGVDPRGIGVCGLSSGGHLAACLVRQRVGADSRPDFLIVGYAPISTNATGRTVIPDKPALPPPEKQALYEAMQPDAQLIDNPPPVFIVYAANDAVVPVQNAYRLHRAWIDKGGKAELHVFADAPHGFALREKTLPVGKWPELCAAWLKAGQASGV